MDNDPVENGGYHHTAPKDEVDHIPEWAEDLDVGDVITVSDGVHPAFDAEIVGFSTASPAVTPPVIDAESVPYDRGSYLETLVVWEDDVVWNEVEVDPDVEGTDGYTNVIELIPDV